MYNADTRQYRADVLESVEFVGDVLEGKLESPLPEVASFLTDTIQSTKGWFRKPLTEDWLATRLRLAIPTETIPADFSGQIRWVLEALFITPDSFTYIYKVVEYLPNEVIDLFLPEVPVLVEAAEAESPTEIRRKHKARVLAARNRAARALFRAERMTQEYSAAYGDHTDWEDEDDASGDE